MNNKKKNRFSPLQEYQPALPLKPLTQNKAFADSRATGKSNSKGYSAQPHSTKESGTGTVFFMPEIIRSANMTE